MKNHTDGRLRFNVETEATVRTPSRPGLQRVTPEEQGLAPTTPRDWKVEGEVVVKRRSLVDVTIRDEKNK